MLSSRNHKQSATDVDVLAVTVGCILTKFLCIHTTAKLTSTLASAATSYHL